MKTIKRQKIYKNLIIGGAVLAIGNFASHNAIAKTPILNERVAAIVNDEPITSFDLSQRTRFILITAGVDEPSQNDIMSATQQALTSLVNEKLQIQEAKKFNVTMSDAEVDQILTSQAKQNGATLDAFFKDLRSAGLSIQSYRDKTRAEYLWRRIVMGRYSSKIKISKEQVSEAMARIEASASKPQYQVSEIFIEVASPEEDERAFEGSKTLVQKIRSGDSFARNAVEYSYLPSAATGGDLGWVVEGELKPEVARAIESMPIGQVSDPIKVNGGYMIVLVRNKRSSGITDTTLNLRHLSYALTDNSDTTLSKAKALFANVKAQFSTCEGVKKLADKNNIKSDDIGQVALSTLDEPYSSLLKNVDRNQISETIQTGNELEAYVVCDKRVVGNDIPTADQVEESMFDQELSLISRRYLRDITREAAIVTR